MSLTKKGEKAIADLFAILDRNQNGEIDEAEQEEAMKYIHSIVLPKARWTWIAMDTDGDGTISESEFLKGMQAISDEVGEEQLLDSIIRAWPDHPLALEIAKEEKKAVLATVAQDGYELEYAPESLDFDSEIDIATVMSKPSHRIEGPTGGREVLEEYSNFHKDGTCTYFKMVQIGPFIGSGDWESHQWTGTFSMKKLDEETVQATCQFTKRLYSGYEETGKWEDMDMTSTHKIKLSDLKQA